MLHIEPISIRKANEFVEMHHRHHSIKIGCRFAIACFDKGGGDAWGGNLQQSCRKECG